MERLNALYASALFDLAIERDNIDESLNQAVFLRDTLRDTGLIRILLHPHISRDEKQKILADAFGGKIQDDLVGFLHLTIDKNRQAFIISILDFYIGLIEKYKRIVTAKVITATQLDDKRIEELRETLAKKLNKHVKIEVNVDPSVIAGPYIYVDGYYLDWTFKTRLRELTVHMKEGCTA